jgi:hypothetical protein
VTGRMCHKSRASDSKDKKQSIQIYIWSIL